MSRLKWLGAALVALVLLPGNAFAQERGSVTGQVVAAETQQPLQGVQVSIPALGSSALTDERGRFLITGVPFGQHTLRVSLIGFEQAELLRQGLTVHGCTHDFPEEEAIVSALKK